MVNPGTVWLLCFLLLTVDNSAYRPTDIVTKFRKQLGVLVLKLRRAFGGPRDQGRSRVSTQAWIARALGESSRHEKNSPVVSIELPCGLIG